MQASTQPLVSDYRQAGAGLRRARFIAVAAAMALSLAMGAAATAQPAANDDYKPDVGQAGKDVIWVPTPQTLVDKMLDMAKVSPQDRLMDLGSGDGRTVITAAQRGLTAQGIEYNPDLVELSRRNAQRAGVADRATFVAADLFQTDLSKADVITMFLLSTINEKLRPTLLQLAPGTRVVSNTFRMGDWEPDASETVTKDCSTYCTALLWIVPAKVEGKWEVDGQTLQLTQRYQMLSGKFGSADISDARMRGTTIEFTANGVRYTGEVNGKTMSGTADGRGKWTAKRA
ncbi:class I SAM-dependent methyltransferase [Achromobacter spanius]|uniref:SAM-dependent methyltransferase n=1 Tax=Achromobacter TaxID=222 RepID=UPI000F8FA09E|nr:MULTISPECIES: class I SAM-dependent methyltransferase [Achromobacter]AZS79670.1 class I SAM-dependent methyltransferase [Achromobacter spanius]MCD0499866.1 class I SAM-dependent methyltransferase [Achromobacter sp. MY14]MCW3152939.1 class I SAM-dependent methyltransferase [Achromobacter spanius]